MLSPTGEHVPPDLSVVIPARDSARTLPRVLERLAAQRRDVPHEVLVVDDGSTDRTADVLRAFQRAVGEAYLRVIRGSRGGPGHARNAGAARARSPLLLFLGSDVLPGARLLERHHALHRREPDARVGCLGFVTWDPDIPPTPFMVFLEHGGPQNAYGAIAGRQWVPPHAFFYGSNVSLKREMFTRVGGFDARRFPAYGWEDLDLGARLARVGFRLFYEPTARGYHHHRLSVSALERRMVIVGRGARVMHARHPSLGVLDLGRERTRRWLRRLCFPLPLRWVLSALARRCERRVAAPRLYRRVLSLAFYNGVHGPPRDAASVWKSS